MEVAKINKLCVRCKDDKTQKWSPAAEQQVSRVLAYIRKFKLIKGGF